MFSLKKGEIQETIKSEDFTPKELATEVKDIGIYSIDKITNRMLENFQSCFEFQANPKLSLFVSCVSSHGINLATLSPHPENISSKT